MKKTICSFSMLLLVATTFAQSLADGIKQLQYGKIKSAKATLQGLYNANSKDAATVYWLGQTMIAADDVKSTKSLYQQAIQGGVNDALVAVGLAHCELLEGADWNSANQKFESAITASLETKGKNKGKPSAAVLNAIGRANCMGHLVKDGSSKFGNVDYAIEKLSQAGAIDATNTDCYIYMGLCYRKMGGEFGGEAQKAYMKALERNTNNPLPNYYIGKIYLSQQNKQSMEQYFNAAIASDIAFAPVYLDYYNFYSERDVVIAKENIEKYIQYADKDCNNDYFYADYLFRAAKYQESLAKAKDLENSDCKMRVPVLYAYNYDRLNDSVQAKTNIEKFLSTAPADKILPNDYAIAVKVLSRFVGTEQQTIGYLNKMIEMESNKNNQINYYTQIAELNGKAKNYAEQIKTIQKIAEMRGTTSEFDYYKMSDAAQLAKDYATGLDIAKKYLAAYPDKPQPVKFYRKAAIGLDPDSTKGLSIQPLTDLNSILEKDIEKNRAAIFNNYYYMYMVYADKLKDYPKALEACDKMLLLYPNPGDENTYVNSQKEMLKKVMANPPKPSTTKPKTASPPTTPAKPASKTTGSTKPAAQPKDVKKK